MFTTYVSYRFIAPDNTTVCGRGHATAKSPKQAYTAACRNAFRDARAHTTFALETYMRTLSIFSVNRNGTNVAIDIIH